MHDTGAWFVGVVCGGGGHGQGSDGSDWNDGSA